MQASVSQSLEAAVQRGFALPAQAARSVLAALEPLVCRGGEWLFRQGDPGDALYLLARGRLQVWIAANESPRPGGSAARLVAEIEPGEFVGEIGLLTGAQRSAGVRAVRNSLLLRMDGAAFERLGREHSEVIRHIAGSIALRLRDRTAGTPKARSVLRTIAVVPLGDAAGASVGELIAKLAGELQQYGPVLTLTIERARELGLPSLPSARGAEPSADVVDWLADVEHRHRFVLLVAEPEASAWSDLVVRNADLILRAGVARSDTSCRPWETQLLDVARGPVARQALVLLHEGSPRTVSGTAAWLNERNVDFHLHVRSGVPGDLERLARILAGTSLGLVLGGGGARGFAHLGVYRALLDAGRPVDWVGGSSIGSVMGAAMAVGMPYAEMLDSVRAAFVDGKPFSDFTLPVVALLRGRSMERVIRERARVEIEDMTTPFFCLSSNLGTGVSHEHTRGSLYRALRASVSLPGVFPPAVVDGELEVDGGILDNLPVDRMRARPVGRVVAVDLASRQTFSVDYGSVPSPWAVLAGKYLPFARRYRVPGFMSMMLKATEIGTMAQARAAGQRADLLVRPDVGRFSITDVRPFDQIVQAGYDAGQRALADWQPG